MKRVSLGALGTTPGYLQTDEIACFAFGRYVQPRYLHFPPPKRRKPVDPHQLGLGVHDLEMKTDVNLEDFFRRLRARPPKGI